ncbi:catalase-like domain-containing protein [Diplogelasinospora grovesii]|uniref:Catalase-like domain-containing protein n=1 Tax=Diplogelasinospora grovesii TaxID=303347 RepID=A0AAN6N783_9PEZI|nr:catalase-like domain-containing protein [Diplogelasinospora grovesii]
MPLPVDEKTVETSKALAETLQSIFGPHPGFRPAHAKGALLTGTFHPTPAAAALSRASHFALPSTNVTARFSSSGGIPELPDTDPNGNPRGLAVRFHLPDSPTGRRVHTDIIAHSVDGFPGTTGTDALSFFQSLKNGTVGSSLETHPKAAHFVGLPKPFPESFGREQYFAVNAAVRYRIVPTNGVRHLTDEVVKTRPEDYLFAGLREGLPVEMKLVAQVGDVNKGDKTDDNTAKWPEDREVVELGVIKLVEVVGEGESKEEQRTIVFDPIPHDPLLEVRAGVYLISGRERRAACPVGH